MRPAAASRTVFGDIGPGHPFGPALDRVRERLAEREVRPGDVVDGEVRGRRAGAGWALDRIHCTIRPAAPPTARPFAATTLYWSEALGDPVWFTFPDDPCLPGLGTWLRGPAGRRSSVLRYVPLRRFTARTGPAADRVVKFKRPSRLHDSLHRVQAVALAARGSEVRVPDPLGPEPGVDAYAQRVVEGLSMDRVVHATGLTGLLVEAGRIHAAFHALRADLPTPAPDRVLTETVRDIAWLGALRPELARELDRLRDRLSARWPSPEPVAPCHGDPVPSHLVADGRGWTVIDHDLAHLGDPHRDVALMLAGLPAELGDLAGDAAAAYLEGYRERAEAPLRPDALAWHRAAATVHLLAVAAAKDRWHRDDVPVLLAELGIDR